MFLFIDLKKDIQELYGLISYSVLRKKLRGGNVIVISRFTMFIYLFF